MILLQIKIHSTPVERNLTAWSKAGNLPNLSFVRIKNCQTICWSHAIIVNICLSVNNSLKHCLRKKIANEVKNYGNM